MPLWRGLAIALLAMGTLIVGGAVAQQQWSGDCFDEVVVSGDNLDQVDVTSISPKRVVPMGEMDDWQACQAACANSSHTPVCHSWTYFFANATKTVDLSTMVESLLWEPSPYARHCFLRTDHFWNPQFAFGNRLVSGINCKSPPSTALPNAPPPNVHFSWDHVPVFFHSANITGVYTQESLEIMAKFPLVTIEKFQGPDSGYKYPQEQWKCCEEDRIVETLKAVKKINPNVTGIFYYNLVLDFPQYRLHQNYVKNESWWLSDDNGNAIRMKGGSHQNPDMLVYNTNIPAVGDLFIHACTDLVSTGAVDGCFVDRPVDGLPHSNLSADHFADLQMSHMTTLQRFQAQLKSGPLIANHAYSMPGINAVMIETFGANEQAIAQLQWMASRGKLVEAHMTGTGSCYSDEGIQNHLAAFLIGAGEYAYFGCGAWFTTETSIDYHWHPSFEKPLGEPQGPAVKEGNVYTRKFASGTVVTFDVSSKNGTIHWAQ